MRSGDGVSVDEGEELLEDGEEGPVGEDADALLHLQAAVCDRPPVDHAEQPEPHALPLRQQLPGERLVELDGCSVNLRRERGGYRQVELETSEPQGFSVLRNLSVRVCVLSLLRPCPRRLR